MCANNCEILELIHFSFFDSIIGQRDFCEAIPKQGIPPSVGP